MLHLKDPAVEIVKKGGKRPINDCPFYNMQYGFDELPLDPIKDFLQEKICKYFVADSKKGQAIWFSEYRITHAENDICVNCPTVKLMWRIFGNHKSFSYKKSMLGAGRLGIDNCHVFSSIDIDPSLCCDLL